MNTLFITKKSWAYYERHCKGKIKHKAMHHVARHLEGLKRRYPNEAFTWYVCRFCSNMHIGHVKTSPTAQEQGQAASAGAS